MVNKRKDLLDRLNIAKPVIGYTKALIIALPLLAALLISLIGMDIAYTNVTAASDTNITDLARVDSVDEVIIDLARAAVSDTLVIDFTRINVAGRAAVVAYARIEANDAIIDLTRTNAADNAEAGLSRANAPGATIALDR